MDLSFQNEAFLKLDDNRKQAMLANSKLKDELGLLSVGLSALGVRYERDTRMVIDARVHLDDLERKVHIPVTISTLRSLNFLLVIRVVC